MNQFLSNIAGAIPPPSHPQEVPRDWAAVEDAFGMMLPRDYREFISLYGSGWFDPLELHVWNLSVVKPDVGWVLGQHEFCLDAEDRSRPTLLELAREIPLFPWGDAIQATFFWAMSGPVEDWHVIVSTDSAGMYHRFSNHSTTRFLAAVLLAEDADIMSLWSPDCFSHPQEFFPAE